MGGRRSKKIKLTQRQKRKIRIRKKIFGTAEKPRLCVYRSLKHTYAQLIDDDKGVVLAAASTRDNEVASKIGSVELEGLHGSAKSTKGVLAAAVVGQTIAEKGLAKGIERVVFDRNGYVYHGRVKAVGEGARKGGLKF
ncbi:MAG: 50S ribosomal protein L18 [Candidatus Dadabacteria bacterium]|nr:MAG: 50S ribosomal protein L18 [Candidatus Dadabacteria bacterium]